MTIAASVSTPSIPSFRIEVKQKGSPATAPWTLFHIALSERQAGEKVASYTASYPEFDFAAVSNDWAEESDASAQEAELLELRAFRKSVQDNCGTDDIPTLMKAITDAREAPARMEELRLRANAAEDELILLKDPDATAAASPVYPFGPGDTLRDVHTDVLVKVTAVGRDAKGGDGFDWETAGGGTGHCPEQSIGCFETVKEKATAHKAHAKHSPAPSHPVKKKHPARKK